jgi:hypothetical protein
MVRNRQPRLRGRTDIIDATARGNFAKLKTTRLDIDDC